MSKEDFGWSLPPGVSQSDIDRTFGFDQKKDRCEDCNKIIDNLDRDGGNLCAKCAASDEPLGQDEIEPLERELPEEQP